VSALAAAGDEPEGQRPEGQAEEDAAEADPTPHPVAGVKVELDADENEEGSEEGGRLGDDDGRCQADGRQAEGGGDSGRGRHRSRRGIVVDGGGDRSTVVPVPGRDPSEEVAAPPDAELHVDPAEVGADGRLAEDEGLGDLPVRLAFEEEAGDPLLRRSSAAESRSNGKARSSSDFAIVLIPHEGLRAKV
jgi:hypothetical protein